MDHLIGPGAIATNGQRMRFCVENILVQRNQIIRGKQQIQVLQRFGDKEGFLAVIWLIDTFESVESCIVATEPLDGLGYRPAPFPVLDILGDPPHVKQ